MSYEAVLGSTKFQPVSCSDSLCIYHRGSEQTPGCNFVLPKMLYFSMWALTCVLYIHGKSNLGMSYFEIASFLWVRLRLTQRWAACATLTQSFGQGPKGLGQRFRGLRALQFDHHPPTINKKNPGERGVPLSSYTLISFHSFIHFYQTILPNVYK